MSGFELNRTIHQPVRTRIIALLINVGSADYNEIKRSLSLSDGHMTTHMRELTGKGYVEAAKSFVNNKPRTTYSLTDTGREEFRRYLDRLRTILDI